MVDKSVRFGQPFRGFYQKAHRSRIKITETYPAPCPRCVRGNSGRASTGKDLEENTVIIFTHLVPLQLRGYDLEASRQGTHVLAQPTRRLARRPPGSRCVQLRHSSFMPGLIDALRIQTGGRACTICSQPWRFSIRRAKQRKNELPAAVNKAKRS